MKKKKKLKKKLKKQRRRQKKSISTATPCVLSGLSSGSLWLLLLLLQHLLLPPSHRPLAWAVPPFRLSLLAPLAPAAALAMESLQRCFARSLSLGSHFFLFVFLFTLSLSSRLHRRRPLFFSSPPNLTLSTLSFLSIPTGWSSRYRITLTVRVPLYGPVGITAHPPLLSQHDSATPARPAVPPANHAAPKPTLKAARQKKRIAQGSLSPDSAARCLVLPPAHLPLTSTVTRSVTYAPFPFCWCSSHDLPCQSHVPQCAGTLLSLLPRFYSACCLLAALLAVSRADWLPADVCLCKTQTTGTGLGNLPAVTYH